MKKVAHLLFLFLLCGCATQFRMPVAQETEPVKNVNILLEGVDSKTLNVVRDEMPEFSVYENVNESIKMEVCARVLEESIQVPVTKRLLSILTLTLYLYKVETRYRIQVRRCDSNVEQMSEADLYSVQTRGVLMVLSPLATVDSGAALGRSLAYLLRDQIRKTIKK